LVTGLLADDWTLPEWLLAVPAALLESEPTLGPEGRVPLSACVPLVAETELAFGCDAGFAVVLWAVPTWPLAPVSALLDGVVADAATPFAAEPPPLVVEGTARMLLGGAAAAFGEGPTLLTVPTTRWVASARLRGVVLGAGG